MHASPLRKEDVESYLNGRLSSLGLEGSHMAVEEITENTQVNYVFKASIENGTARKTLYLKQATPKLKAKGWPFPVERIRYEALTLQKFKNLLGRGVVPDVIFYDDDKHVLVLSDIRQKGVLLIDEFEKGRVHPQTAPRFGALLGMLHGKSFGTTDTIRPPDDEIWMKDFIYDFKTSGAAKFAESEVKELIEESESVTKCFLGVDFADKNIFVDGSEVRFCDFEGVFRGDPAFDVGHVLAHYLLQAENNPLLLSEVSKFFHQFMKHYRVQMETLNVPCEYLTGVDQRSARYIGVFMLHRSHGKSPYKFFKPGIEEKIKDDSLILIRSKPTSPENALEILSLTSMTDGEKLR
jgi:5-methylthioribose kinase